MKKLWITGLCCLLLCGCGAEQTGETVADEFRQPAAVMQRSIQVELPGEAAVPAMEGENSRYYICDDYEISLETFPSGDVNATIRTLSGYEKKDLTVVETELEGVKRYDFVWASEGEQGQRLGRASILDDGHYHYTLSVLRDAEKTEKSQVVWRTVFESFHLS